MIAISVSFPFSFAQHHGGTQAPPISFGAGEVTVGTYIIPEDFTPTKYYDANVKPAGLVKIATGFARKLGLTSLAGATVGYLVRGSARTLLVEPRNQQ